MRDALLDQLELLYSELAATPRHRGGNDCGQCRLCCTASGLNVQKVTQLELGLLERHYGLQSMEAFSTYAERIRDQNGNFVHPVCPNYADRCQVYQHRPFSCRTFGHFRMAATTLPSECVFVGLDQEFPSGEYYRTVPGAARLRALSRDYQLFFPHLAPQSEQEEGGEGGFDFLNLEDPYDRAFALLLSGQPHDAWELVKDASGLFGDYLRALVGGMLDKHEDAYESYRRLVGQIQDRADFWTFAGFHAFVLSRFPEAEECLLRALQIDAAVPMAQGFMGYLRLQQERHAEAAGYFERALALDPDNAVYAQRLELARQLTGSPGATAAPPGEM